MWQNIYIKCFTYIYIYIHSVLLKGDRRSLKKHCVLIKLRESVFPFQTCDVFLGRDVYEFTGRVLGMLEHPLHLTGGRRRESESIFSSCCDDNCFYMSLQVLAKKLLFFTFSPP